MVDRTEEERRRLTAAWLNIIAAGLVSAGLLQALIWLVTEGWGERAMRLLVLGAGCLLAGFGVHLIARAFIPRSPPRASPHTPDPSIEQSMNNKT